MQDGMNPDMYLLCLFCPKLSNMYLKSCDIIMIVKYEKHCAGRCMVLFCVQKGVLQDGKDDSQTENIL